MRPCESGRRNHDESTDAGEDRAGRSSHSSSRRLLAGCASSAASQPDLTELEPPAAAAEVADARHPGGLHVARRERLRRAGAVRRGLVVGRSRTRPSDRSRCGSPRHPESNPRSSTPRRTAATSGTRSASSTRCIAGAAAARHGAPRRQRRVRADPRGDDADGRLRGRPHRAVRAPERRGAGRDDPRPLDPRPPPPLGDRSRQRAGRPGVEQQPVVLEPARCGRRRLRRGRRATRRRGRPGRRVQRGDRAGLRRRAAAASTTAVRSSPTTFSGEEISGIDFFHPSIAGQRAIAEIAWDALEGGSE